MMETTEPPDAPQPRQDQRFTCAGTCNANRVPVSTISIQFIYGGKIRPFRIFQWCQGYGSAKMRFLYLSKYAVIYSLLDFYGDLISRRSFQRKQLFQLSRIRILSKFRSGSTKLTYKRKRMKKFSSFAEPDTHASQEQMISLELFWKQLEQQYQKKASIWIRIQDSIHKNTKIILLFQGND